VGITAEIAEDMFGSAEGRLGIDVPVLLTHFLDQLFEPAGIAEISGGTAAIEQVFAVELAKSGKELLAEDVVQYRNGQQEQRVAGGNPSLMIGGQSAAGDHAMDVIMAQQGLTPGMQDGEESDLCAEPFWIGSHFEQGLRTGIEQQIEERPRRSQCQGVQFVGHGEHEVEVVGVQQIPLLCFKPSPALLRLALGAASGSAGNGEHPITCLMGSLLLWGVRRRKWMKHRSSERDSGAQTHHKIGDPPATVVRPLLAHHSGRTP
jgi:hypothetical protein